MTIGFASPHGRNQNIDRNRADQRTNLIWILAGSLVLMLLCGWAVLMLFPVIQVSGSATVFDDVSVAISVQGLGFAVETRPEATRIRAAGRLVEFLDSHAVLIDGKEAGIIDDSVENMTLNINHDGVIIESNGQPILTHR